MRDITTNIAVFFNVRHPFCRAKIFNFNVTIVFYSITNYYLNAQLRIRTITDFSHIYQLLLIFSRTYLRSHLCYSVASVFCLSI